MSAPQAAGTKPSGSRASAKTALAGGSPTGSTTYTVHGPSAEAPGARPRMWTIWLAGSYTTRLPRPGNGLVAPTLAGPSLAASPATATTSYVGVAAVPDVAYSLVSPSPVTSARPWAPPSSGTVAVTVALDGSMNVTPSAVATATRETGVIGDPGQSSIG